MNVAAIGSISTGTLRAEDLLDSFSRELENLVQCNADDAGIAEEDSYMKLITDAHEVDPESYEASELVDELADALNDFAPAYCYFGAHPGDSADFGFWLDENMSDDFDGLKVSDTSEVPADYSGEVLHINDHGNMALYVAEKGVLTEVWAVC
jgi:hypothetical protein